MSSRRFEGKVAVVTGAASGIGEAAARLFAAEGAAVAVVDVSQQGKLIADDIALAGGRSIFVQADVSSEDAWSELSHAVQRELGAASILHSNAFVSVSGAVAELSLEDWNLQLGVNLTALFLGVRALLPQLVETQGCVVATSSVHAIVGLGEHPAYAASKAGICGLIRQLATEYGPEVRFNAVLPGPILTPSWDGRSDEDFDRAARATALGRLGTSDEVAKVVGFLASEDASYMTGASVVVDGGWSTVKDSP